MTILHISDTHEQHTKITNLYAKVLDVKPRLHLFGHDHNVYGSEERFGTIFSNAAVVDSQYVMKKEAPLIYSILCNAGYSNLHESKKISSKTSSYSEIIPNFERIKPKMKDFANESKESLLSFAE